MSGEVLIATGAVGGLGEVYARSLAEADHRVAVADLADPTGIAEEIEGAGGPAPAVNVAVSDLDSTEAWRMRYSSTSSVSTR